MSLGGKGGGFGGRGGEGQVKPETRARKKRFISQSVAIVMRPQAVSRTVLLIAPLPLVSQALSAPLDFGLPKYKRD